MTTPQEATPGVDGSADAPTGFGAYLFAHTSWFVALGVQMVLFPYLVGVVLHEGPIRFGLAQMSLQLPTTILILLGGFFADRVDGRRIIIAASALTVLTFLGLGGLVAAGKLTYGLLIAYALVMGVIGAFATPARDSLLSQVAPDLGNLQKAVAGASLAQFGGQIVGMLLAIAAPILGVASLLFGQAVLMVAGVFAAVQLRPRPVGARAPREGHPLQFLARQIGEGFQAAIASPVIAPVLICAIGMGVCFMGAFSVLLPLMVKGYFPVVTDGKANTAIASAFGVFSLCFWVGSMLSAMVLMRRGQLRRPGRAYLIALATGASVLVVCALPMPLWLLCVLNFVWGLGGGVAMTLGRGLVQAYAPPEKRARVLSIFTLGMMGGGPLGAVAYGFLAHEIGARQSIIFPGLLMLVIVGVVTARSRLWRLGET